jgi:hypothetical protein
VQGGAGKDAIAGCLAENVVLIGPLSDEPLTGREAVAEAITIMDALAPCLTRHKRDKAEAREQGREHAS